MVGVGHTERTHAFEVNFLLELNFNKDFHLGYSQLYLINAVVIMILT